MRLRVSNIILPIIVLTNLLSCARIKSPENFKSQINTQNYKKLEGTYKNLSVNHQRPFWEKFADKKSMKDHEIISDSTSVFKIKFLPDDKIKFELYIENDLKVEETKKYIHRDNGIAIKGISNYRYLGIPLIFYQYESQALWFSKDNESELFLSFNGSSSGGIFLLIFGEPLLGESRYEKVSNNAN